MRTWLPIAMLTTTFSWLHKIFLSDQQAEVLYSVATEEVRTGLSLLPAVCHYTGYVPQCNGAVSQSCHLCLTSGALQKA